jgi:Fe-S oxidoreductase
MTVLNDLKKYSWIVKAVLHLPWSVKKDVISTLMTAQKKYFPPTSPHAHVENVLKCALCPNMCRFDCPVLDCVKSESTSPAGKARIAYLYEMDRLKSKETVDLMYACAGCGACLQWCPFGFCVGDLLQGVRRDIIEQDPHYVPSSVMDLKETLVTYHTTYPQGSTSLHTAHLEGDILYFAGCTALNRTQEIPAAVLTILEKTGIKYATLPEEWCCGAPLLMAGFFNEFKAFAQHNKNELSRFKYILCSCPTCAYTFTEIYASMGLSLNIPVVHITEFLFDLLDRGILDLKEGEQEGTYVYHDPCILSRKLQVVNPPRTLLTSIPGVRLSETHFSGSETRCCGMGGLLSVTHPHVSCEMGKKRVWQLESAASHIVSACPACKVSLNRGGASHITDIAEIIANSLAD